MCVREWRQSKTLMVEKKVLLRADLMAFSLACARDLISPHDFHPWLVQQGRNQMPWAERCVWLANLSTSTVGERLMPRSTNSYAAIDFTLGQRGSAIDDGAGQKRTLKI